MAGCVGVAVGPDSSVGQVVTIGIEVDRGVIVAVTWGTTVGDGTGVNVEGYGHTTSVGVGEGVRVGIGMGVGTFMGC